MLLYLYFILLVFFPIRKKIAFFFDFFFHNFFFLRPQKKNREKRDFFAYRKKDYEKVSTNCIRFGLAIGVNFRVYLSTVTAKKKRVEETEYVQGPVHWIVLVDHKRKKQVDAHVDDNFSIELDLNGIALQWFLNFSSQGNTVRSTQRACCTLLKPLKETFWVKLVFATLQTDYMRLGHALQTHATVFAF